MTDLISRAAVLAAIDAHPAPKGVRDEFARVIRALPAAQVKVEKLVEALRRIREAWPTVRDAEGSGGTISAAIDEIDAALAEIEGEK